MKAALLILTFLFIQTAVSQVTRQDCLDAGITDSSLPGTVPVENPATGGPCTNYSCCTSAYIDKLTDSIRNKVFRECIRDTFSRVIDVAEDIFDDFRDLFGNSGRRALISSFSARAEVGDDTRDVYIDNELSYFSQLLANITFGLIRGDTDTNRFRIALREYACGFLASVVQKRFYNTTLRTGRLSGKCICNLTIADSRSTVGDRVDTIIDASISRFTSIINNILRLIKAISGIRDVSIRNLRNALDYNVSSLCSRQYINALACQHCRGDNTRGCPASCRLVTLFCLQPLNNALSVPYASFVRFVTLTLSTVVGNNSDSTSPFDLHNIQEVAGKLNDQLSQLASDVMLALSVPRGETLEDNACFISKSRDIEDGRVICKNTTTLDKSDYETYCKRIDGEMVIVDVDTDTDSEDNDRTDTDNSGTRGTRDTGSDSDSDSDSDNFERTDAERDFEKFVRVLSERLRVFGNYQLIYNRISQCVCRASSSGNGDSDDSGRDDDAGEDRLTTLFISQSQPCFERYTGDQSPRGLDDNPAFQSLTQVEQSQARMFSTVVSSRFTNPEQTVADDPDISATFSELAGGSAAGRTFASFLFVLCAAILTVLFVLV